MTDMAYMARRPYSSTFGSLAHATVSMVFYGEDLEISNTGKILWHKLPVSLFNLWVFLIAVEPEGLVVEELFLFCNLSPISVTLQKYSELVLGFRCPWFFPIWVFHVNPCVSIIYRFIRISLDTKKGEEEEEERRSIRVTSTLRQQDDYRLTSGGEHVILCDPLLPLGLSIYSNRPVESVFRANNVFRRDSSHLTISERINPKKKVRDYGYESPKPTSPTEL
ncbi:hypothetical protein LXL04_035887 [Taraxacum kok-saghyz]